MRQILFVWMLVVIMLTSWANNAEKAASESATVQPESKVQDDLRQKGYRIITETYSEKNDKKDIKISYPQIIGLRDRERQERINNLLKKEALQLIILPDDDNRHFSMGIQYKISWQGEHLLSIQYSGSEYFQGAPYSPNVFFTTNVDILKGSKLRLQDVINVDESFVSMYRDEKMKAIRFGEVIDGKKAFADGYRETLDKTMELFDKSDLVYPDNWGVYCYFTPDSLGISVQIAHYLGDHAEFEVKYKDIINNIKTNSPVWKDFFLQTYSEQGR